MESMSNKCLNLDANGDNSFETTVARSLLPLAELARSTEDLTNLFLPPGWNKLAIVTCAPQTFQHPRVKGFLTSGLVGDETTTSAVLALGIDWSEWMQYYFNGPMQGIPLPSWAGAPPDALIAYVYNSMYQSLRDSLWDSLKFLTGMPLQVTGIGLAGPLAQLAALDLREGNSGPQDQSAPGNVDCYAFSTGTISNQSFADYYPKEVALSYTITAGTKADKIDYFPLESTGKFIGELGSNVSITTPLPAFDAPWVERSSDLYLKALDGTPVFPPTQTPFIEQVDGFSRQLAFQFANLSAVSYQRFQHPNAQTMNISPYTVGKSITASGVNFATIFTSVDSVAIAIRGTCTWQEFADYESNSQTKTIAIGENSFSVHTGASNLFYGPSDTANADTSFRDVLLSEIKDIVSEGTKIYFTGHGFGGAIANLAALDFAVTEQLPITAIYTFGANPTGGPGFTRLSDSTFSNKSFQVARSSDPFPKLSDSWIGYSSLNTQVSVTGVPKNDSYPNHSIASYSQLLDPKE